MSKLSDNIRGAIFMMLSMAGFVFNDVLMKSMSSDIPMFQALFLRGIAATILMGFLAYRQKALWHRLSRADGRMVGLRTLGEIGATIGFITALFNMPIANATAILQVMPLTVTLAAAVFLGEAVGWRRYTAIIIGFFGVLLIVRPGFGGFTIYSMFALSAVLFLTLRDLTTRRLTHGIPSTFVAFISAAAIMAVSGLLSLSVSWVPITALQAAKLVIAAAFLLAGYLFGVMTMRVGEISFISPFRYSVLLWAILLGFVVFGDIPDQPTIIGSVIVVLTGLYTFYRERRLAEEPGRQVPDNPRS